MKTYELNYGNKATVNVGNYENLNPMFNIKVVIEAEKINITEEFNRIKLIVDDQLKQSIEDIRLRKRLADIKHLRFKEVNGVLYPHVTDIISPDPLEIPNIELYGERGDIFHEMFAKDNWKPIYTDAEEAKFQLIGGIRNFDFSWVKDDIKFEFDQSEVEVINHEKRYVGKYDKDGLYDSVPAVFDLKSGNMTKQAQERTFIQLAAYAVCVPNIERLVIIPCNPKNEKKPLFTDDIDKYYAMFLQKRAIFFDRFGV